MPLQQDFIKVIGKEIDDRYMEELKKQVDPSGSHQGDGEGH